MTVVLLQDEGENGRCHVFFMLADLCARTSCPSTTVCETTSCDFKTGGCTYTILTNKTCISEANTTTAVCATYRDSSGALRGKCSGASVHVCVGNVAVAVCLAVCLHCSPAIGDTCMHVYQHKAAFSVEANNWFTPVAHAVDKKSSTYKCFGTSWHAAARC